MAYIDGSALPRAHLILRLGIGGRLFRPLCQGARGGLQLLTLGVELSRLLAQRSLGGRQVRAGRRQFALQREAVGGQGRGGLLDIAQLRIQLLRAAVPVSRRQRGRCCASPRS
jgi:hypothetical protein